MISNDEWTKFDQELLYSGIATDHECINLVQGYVGSPKISTSFFLFEVVVT